MPPETPSSGGFMPSEEPIRPTADGPVHARQGLAYGVAGILLLAPFVALLWVSSYAKDEPRLWGFPFFYWYQLLWVFLASLLTYGAYRLIRGTERTRARLTDRSER
jgi:membrane protein implicated in regulation of membrane protease activity